MKLIIEFYNWIKSKSYCLFEILAFLAQWDMLRKIGNKKIVQFTIVIPIIGYYLLFSSELKLYYYTVFDAQLSNEEIPWKLLYYYYGFLAMGFASVLFNWTCPNEIQRNGDKEQFAMNEIHVTHRSKCYEMISTIFNAYSKEADKKGTRLDVFFQCRKLPVAIVSPFMTVYEKIMQDDAMHDVDKLYRHPGAHDVIENMINDSSVDIMYGYYDSINRSMSWLRGIIFSSYIIGFVCILFPAVNTLMQVVSYTWELLT